MAKKLKLDKKKINFRYNFTEYWNILKNYKQKAALLLFLILIIELVRVVPRFLFKEIVDNGTLFANGYITINEFSLVLIFVSGIYIVSSLVDVVSVWFRSHYLARMETQMITELKTKYFNHIVNLDHNFHITHKTGSLISRLSRGSNSIERITDVLVFNFIPFVFQLIVITSSSF